MAREAAISIGYTKMTWDDDTDPEYIFWLWSELDEDKQNAATTLGYDADSWNEYVYKHTYPNYYNNYLWQDLPREIKVAGKVLGYNRRRWNENRESKYGNLLWDQLTLLQKEAARRFGYSRISWDRN